MKYIEYSDLQLNEGYLKDCLRKAYVYNLIIAGKCLSIYVATLRQSSGTVVCDSMV